MSEADEYGQYFGWALQQMNDSTKKEFLTYQKKWKKLLSQNPSISLTQIKAKILEDAAYNPSLVLTSDSLARDTAKFLCPAQAVAPDSESNCPTCVEQVKITAAPEIENLKSDISAIQCQSCFTPELQKLDKTVAYLDSFYDSLDQFFKSAAINHFKKKDPKKYDRLRRQLQGKENARQKALDVSILRTKSPDLIFKIFEDEVEKGARQQKIESDVSVRQKLDVLSIESNEDFENHLKATDFDPSKASTDLVEFVNFIKDPMTKDSIEKILGVQIDYLNSNKKINLSDLRYSYSHLYEKLQSKRKITSASADAHCRQLAESYFNKPQNKTLKETYVSIRRCEDSPLNK